MAAIDSDVQAYLPTWDSSRRRTTLALAGTALALGVAIATFSLRGGDQNAARSAAMTVFRASSIAFLLYYLASPLARLLRSRATVALARQRMGLALAFASMFVVFLGCAVMPDYLSGAHVPLPTLVFGGFSALILVAVLAGEYAGRASAEWRPALRAMECIGVAYFWLIYAVNDLDHITGPHREDLFYNVSLTVLVLALLVRFGGSFVERYKVARG